MESASVSVASESEKIIVAGAYEHSRLWERAYGSATGRLMRGDRGALLPSDAGEPATLRLIK
jgi:hypothetical protein